MTPAQCRSLRKPPNCRRGHLRRTGRYLRGAFAKSIGKWHEKDTDVPPKYGLRAKAAGFRWDVGDDELENGLSSECVSCVCEPKCTAVLGHDDHVFVIEINVDALSSELRIPIAARYAPLKDNPCHFCLIPEDGAMDQVRQAMKFLLTQTKTSPKSNDKEAVSKELTRLKSVERAIRVVVTPQDLL